MMWFLKPILEADVISALPDTGVTVQAVAPDSGLAASRLQTGSGGETRPALQTSRSVLTRWMAPVQRAHRVPCCNLRRRNFCAGSPTPLVTPKDLLSVGCGP